MAFSPDGTRLLAGSDDHTLKLWDAATGQLLRAFEGHAGRVNSVAFFPDGLHVLSGSSDKSLILWDVATGRRVRTFRGHTEGIEAVAVSPDGLTGVSGSVDDTLNVWDLASGQPIRTFKAQSEGVRSVAFSPDGKWVLSGSDNGTLKLWDVAGEQPVRTYRGHSGSVFSVAFSPEGSRILSCSISSGKNPGELKLWDTASGRIVRTFDTSGDAVWSVAFSPGGEHVISGNGGWPETANSLKLWDAFSGELLRTFDGHSGAIYSVAFSPDGGRLLSGSSDSTVRTWNAANGRLLATLFASSDKEWLTITAEGFFLSSHRDSDMLAIVRGTDATAIGQVHQSLFNPDLVREALAGDPDGEVARAAKVVNLEKVLDSGSAPRVEIVSHPPGSKSDTDLLTVAARIADRGKGVGRVEWRVNGVTAGVMSAPQGPGPDYDVSQQLALDPGENRIEVIAYEGRNLLASLPAQTTITYRRPGGCNEAEALCARHRRQ